MAAALAAYTPPNSLPKLNGFWDTHQTCFDLIAGTSTGAIIAGAAVSDIPMSEIVELFETETPYIFRRRWYRIPLFLSKYPSEQLAQIIAKHIPAAPLGEIESPLMITSSEITKSEVHIFRSNYESRDSEGTPATSKEVCLRDAILASCAAPTFFAPKSVDNFLLADGCLWANNPSTIAATEALSVFRKEARKIRMLSIGTGHSTNMYRQRRGWGFITGWGGAKLTSYVMTLQAQASAHIAKLLLKGKLFTHQSRNRSLGDRYPNTVRYPQISRRARFREVCRRD